MSCMNTTSAALAEGEGTAVAASVGPSVFAASPGRPGAMTGAVELADGVAGALAQPARASAAVPMTMRSARRTRPP